MLGFATVDVSRDSNTLTIWLTSQLDVGAAGHTNAVTFVLDDTFEPVRAEGMVADWYVVLTERTDTEHSAFAGWEVTPCDVGLLASETAAVQDALLAAVGNRTQPTLAPPAESVDQAARDSVRAALLTLAVAYHVRGTWAAWLATESERVKRVKQMPDGLDGAH